MKKIVLLAALVSIFNLSAMEMHDSAAGAFPDSPNSARKKNSSSSQQEDLPDDAAEFIRRCGNRQFVYKANHTHVYNHAKFNPTKSFSENTGDAFRSGTMQAIEAIPLLLFKHGIDILTAEYMMWRKSSPVLTKELERHLEAEQLIEKRIVEIRGWIKLTETFVKKHKDNPTLEHKFKKQLKLLAQQEAAIELKAVELKIKTNDLIQKIGRSVAPDQKDTEPNSSRSEEEDEFERYLSNTMAWDMTHQPAQDIAKHASIESVDTTNESDEAPAAA